MVATVRSASWLCGFTPGGSWTVPMWIESPTSRPVRSTVK